MRKLTLLLLAQALGHLALEAQELKPLENYVFSDTASFTGSVKDTLIQYSLMFAANVKRTRYFICIGMEPIGGYGSFSPQGGVLLASGLFRTDKSGTSIPGGILGKLFILFGGRGAGITLYTRLNYFLKFGRIYAMIELPKTYRSRFADYPLDYMRLPIVGEIKTYRDVGPTHSSMSLGSKISYFTDVPKFAEVQQQTIQKIANEFFNTR
ncbi:MAG: hypothetical protein SFY70_11945 [Bacteroidia bacterium]|nr:hypothetical protein [Bacteroidia bacterium]